MSVFQRRPAVTEPPTVPPHLLAERPVPDGPVHAKLRRLRALRDDELRRLEAGVPAYVPPGPMDLHWIQK